MADLSTSNASTLSAVDLSRLPFPDFLVPKSFDDIKAEMLADVQASAIARTGLPYIFHEGDPAYIVIEACAYRRWRDLMDYQQQVKNMLIAYAEDEWLDHLGANPDFKCERLTIIAANPDATPPVEAVMESNDDYRRRLTLTNEGYTSAGSSGAYLFHALSASGDVRDASVTSPLPGQVLVTILSHSNNGIASAELLALEQAALNAEEVRPLCDQVITQSATVLTYTVALRGVTYPGADIPDTLGRAQVAVEAYVNKHFKLGHDITRAGLDGAAMVEGMQNVFVDAPATDLATDLTQARRCLSTALTHAGTAL